MLDRHAFTVIAILTGLTATSQARADDACTDILRAGIRDVFSTVQDGTLVEAAKTWACTADAARVGVVMSAATAPIVQGVRTGPAFRPAALATWRRAHCRSPRFRFTQADAERIANAVLAPFSPDTVAAAADCNNASRATGPRSSLSARITTFPDAEGNFQLQLAWPGTHAPDATAPTLSNPQVTGATCTRLTNSLRFNASGAAVDVACHRVGRGRVTFTLNTSENPVHPAPALPAMPTAAICGSADQLARVSVASDPGNCGGCEINCGAQGTCVGGYCTECVFGIGELTLQSGSNTFPVGPAAQMPATCRMAAGPVSATLESTVWVQPGRHGAGENFCTTAMSAGVALRLNGTLQRGFQNTVQDPSDNECNRTVALTATGRTTLAHDGPVSAAVVVTRCEHDGTTNPCVFRNAVLRLSSTIGTGPRP